MRIILLVLLFLVGGVAPAPLRAQTADGSTLPAPLQEPLNAARAAMINDPPAALAAAARAERAALDQPLGPVRRTGLAYSRWLGGEALLRLERAGPADRMTDSAQRLATAIGSSKLLGDVLMTRGGIFASRGRAAEALTTYQAAHKAFVDARDTRGQAIALQNIANLYLDGRDFANADRYFRQSDEAHREDPILSLTLYNNRATGLLVAEHFDAAIEEYRRALRIAEQQNSLVFRTRILGNITKAQLEKGDVAAGSRTLERAIALVRKPEAASWYRPIAAIAAQAALQRGDNGRARYWIEEAFSGVDLATTSTTLRDGHSTAYEIYRAVGDAPRALAHLQALRRLSDEETKLAASTNTALMAARFDYANQELRIARLKADELSASIALERSRANFQRMLTFGVVGGASVIVVLLSIGLITIRRSRNQVRAANIELEASNVALGEALAAKTEFLATTSHEIRTPLNGILGMTQVMLADRALPAAQRERVNIVHGAGLTMRALVDDILDVAKMETGNLTVAPEPADLRATLQDVARLFREQALAKGLAFDLDIDRAPRWVVTDAARVRQVALNLLSNALKFTASGSIGLAAHADADGRLVRIAVKDTGIGIPAAKHEEIFESFRQADSTTTRQFGGTGLGLTICRNIAEALGGSIAVESAAGQGSTFTVTLPLTEAEAPACQGSSPTGALVLVEGNPIARSMLRTMLAPRAGEVCTAGDVDAAIEMLPGASRLLVDAATLGDTEEARVRTLERLSLAALDNAVTTFVLWKQPAEPVMARIEGMDGVTLVVKPIAGPALAERLFGAAEANPPLVTQAA